MFAYYGTQYSLFQYFLSDLFHWPILICHSNSDYSQDKKGQQSRKMVLLILFKNKDWYVFMLNPK